jgi:hypothetical protein
VVLVSQSVIATDNELDDQMIGDRFLVGLGIFLFDIVSIPALGPTKPPIQWVSGPLSLGVKRPGREVDHSPFTFTFKTENYAASEKR